MTHLIVTVLSWVNSGSNHDYLNSLAGLMDQTGSSSVWLPPPVWQWGSFWLASLPDKLNSQTDPRQWVKVQKLPSLGLSLWARSKFPEKTFSSFLWSRTLDQRFKHKKLVPEIFQFKSDPRWDLASGRGRNFPKKLFLRFCDLGPWIRGLNTKTCTGNFLV